MSPSKETETHVVYVGMTGVVVRFPKCAIYKRKSGRKYYDGDFADGEMVTFSNFSGDDKSTASGYAWYFGHTGKHGAYINIDDLEEIDGEN